VSPHRAEEARSRKMASEVGACRKLVSHDSSNPRGGRRTVTRVARSRGGRRWHCSALARRMTAADWRDSTKNGAVRAGAEGIARPVLALDLGCGLEWQGRLRLAGGSSKQVAKQQHWHEANSGTTAQQSRASCKSSSSSLALPA
jgi:hypothetical protein